MKTAWKTEAEWKDNTSKKGSKRRAEKAAPTSWIAFENNLESKSKMEGNKLPNKTPNNGTSVVDSV